MTRQDDDRAFPAATCAASVRGRWHCPSPRHARHPLAALWYAGQEGITKSSHRLEILCPSHYDQCDSIVVQARSARWIMCLPRLPGETQDVPVSPPHDDRMEEEAGAFVTASSASLLRTAPTHTAADQSPVLSVSLDDGAPQSGAERSRRRVRYFGCPGIDRRHAPFGQIALPGAVGRSDATGLLANSLKINRRELG
jgi:hypothetical protein